MICPRCGNQWDAQKSPCTKCGLVLHFPPTPSSQSINTRTAQPGSNPPLPPTRSQDMASSPTSTPLPGRFLFTGDPSSSVPDTLPMFSTSSPDHPPFRNGRLEETFNGEESNPRSLFSPRREPTTGPLQEHIQNPPLQPHVPLKAHPLTRDSSDKLPKKGQQGPTAFPASQTQASRSAALDSLRSLVPGTILRRGRYRLHELHTRQEWRNGAYEATWIAQDAQRSALPVVICEVTLPTTGLVTIQSMLRTATVNLNAVGHHPHVPTLWDAFSEQERNFFAFEPIEGESLLARMRHTGRPLPEQEVIECCLQMIDVLELLIQQSPPLIHGLIRPEHILITRSGSQYMLTNFSVLLAGGATQFVAGTVPSQLSTYTAPECVQGILGTATDLYALLATAYHAVTGAIPKTLGGSIPPARQLNATVSAQFDAILAKGLRPIPSQRYQRPSELRQDLMTLRSTSVNLAANTTPKPTFRSPIPRVASLVPKEQSSKVEDQPSVPQLVAQTLQSLIPDDYVEERQTLLPRPEDLPPLSQGNDSRNAALWLIGILLCFLLLVILSHGFI